MAWSPLGIYFKENTPQKERVKQVLIPLCEKYNCEEDQLLLAWLLYHPASIYPVVGTTSAARLQKSMEATKINLELPDWFLLLEASMGKPLP
jgi:predicted oxidoreductase